MKRSHIFIASFAVIALIIVFWSSRKNDEKSESTILKDKVYFVCRSQYEIPLGHRVVEFESSSLIDWFRDNWIDKELQKKIFNPPLVGAWVNADKPESELTDEDVVEIYDYDLIHQHTEKTLKGSVYGFSDVWEAMVKWGDTPPQNKEELRRFISTISYYGEVTYQDGALQCFTDDDEIEISWYLFDDAFAKENPERVAYLLHPTWELPEKVSTVSSMQFLDKSSGLEPNNETSADGTVYCVFLSAKDGATISELVGAFHFSGVRLPEFTSFLKSSEVPIEKNSWGRIGPTWPDELILFKALSNSSNQKGFSEFLTEMDSKVLNNKASHSRSLSDFRFKVDQPDFLLGNRRSYADDFKRLDSYIETSRNESRSIWIREMLPARIQTSDHFCQIRFHERLKTKAGHDYEPVDYTWSYVFFDDRWLAANQDIAKSILHYASHWQMLYKAEPITSR